jgi:hypothetical protein
VLRPDPITAADKLRAPVDPARGRSFERLGCDVPKDHSGVCSRRSADTPHRAAPMPRNEIQPRRNCLDHRVHDRDGGDRRSEERVEQLVEPSWGRSSIAIWPSTATSTLTPSQTGRPVSVADSNGGLPNLGDAGLPRS